MLGNSDSEGVPMEEVVRMLGNYLRVCEKHYAKSVQSRLGLACSGNVERIGIVLSKPNHTKSLKNQWRATYAPGYLAAGSLFTRLAEREGFYYRHYLQLPTKPTLA